MQVNMFKAVIYETTKKQHFLAFIFTFLK